ncbi:hypothetical protein AB0O52_01400 [Arthrobacter sp. NPDC080073]|uniref:hypothetical protein n=1 Tax=Arthrobacter sp. NPDC080073 TaxID=3155919 RepID=UPI0034127057
MDRLGRSTVNILALADELREKDACSRALNLGGVDTDTSTPMGAITERPGDGRVSASYLRSPNPNGSLWGKLRLLEHKTVLYPLDWK